MLWTTPTPRQLLVALNAALVAPWAIAPVAALDRPLPPSGSTCSCNPRDGARHARGRVRTVLSSSTFFPGDRNDPLRPSTDGADGYPAVRGVEVVSNYAIGWCRTDRSAKAICGRHEWRSRRTRGYRPSRWADRRCRRTSGRSARPSGCWVTCARRRARLLADDGNAPPRRVRSPTADRVDGRRHVVFHTATDVAAKHEWRELVKYWNEVGRDPVWFVADPLRSDLALIDDPPWRASYRWPRSTVWPTALPMLLGGVRPNEMDWYVIDPPGRYAGEGWSLTPETAGVANEDRKRPGRDANSGLDQAASRGGHDDDRRSATGDSR